MDSAENINFFGIFWGLVWAFKIGYHFNYLKSIDPTIKENTFFTFYLNIYNFRRSSAIVFPVFSSRQADKKTELQHALAKKALLSTLIFWGLSIVMIFYGFIHRYSGN
jgi:hypothetical protein